MNMSRLLAWAPHAHDIVRDVPRARCGIRRVQVRLVFEGAPSGLLSAAALAGLRGLLGRRGAGRLPRRLTAFRGAAAAGAAAAAAGEGAAVTAVTSVLSLTLSMVPFVRRGRVTRHRRDDSESRSGEVPARPSDPTGWTCCRYTAGIPATLPAGLSDPTGVNSSTRAGSMRLRFDWMRRRKFAFAQEPQLNMNPVGPAAGCVLELELEISTRILGYHDHDS